MTKDEKNKDTDDAAIIKAAMKCLEDYQSREADNIRRAEEAIRFRAGEQWPDAIRKDRENPNQAGGARPCPVLDKTNQYVRQIVNEERQNRASIKIRPVDDESDPKVAEIITGIIRNIEDQSEAIVAYTTAGEQAIDGGFGFFRIVADYCDPLSSYQDIKIKRIHNRFSVALGYHMESDGSDAQEGLIWEEVPREKFEEEYPEATEAKSQFNANDSWSSEEIVRVAEYFKIENQKITIHVMQDGEVLSDEDYKQLSEEARFSGVVVPKPIKSRRTIKPQIKWYKLTSDEILERNDLPGTYIPIIKVTGNEIVMPDGTIRLSGAVEAAMDPQRLHNFAHAGFIENVALAPKAPWVAPVDAIAGYENAYEQANRRNIAVLPFNHLDDQGNPIPMPQRTQPAGIAPGWQQMLQNTEHGVEAGFGMYGPSVGARSQEKSGIALKEQKEQGAIGNYHFPDNLARSIQHGGRILLQWIPIYYDTERVARMLGEDGTHEMIKLNPRQERPVMPEMDKFNREIGKIYNINIGKYDVTVSTGPSYTAKRQEAAEQFGNLLGAAPGLLNVIGDLYFKYQDFPGADTLAERMKATLLPAVQQLEQGKEQNLDPKMQAMHAQMQQAGQQLQMQAQQLQQAEQQISQVAQQVGSDKQMVEMAKRELESARKVFEAQVREETANLQLKQMQMQQEAQAGNDPNMDIEAKIVIEKMKQEHEDARFAREMALKEYQAGLVDQPTFGMLGDAINGLAGHIQMIGEEVKKPKGLRIVRDAAGEIESVNGRPVERDQMGNLIGVGNGD